MAQAGGERLQRGSVRLQTELGSGCLPELTRWRPMKSGCWLQERRQQANRSKSGSMTDRASREAQKCLKQSQVWGEEQRRRRRLWRGGSAEDFKRRIDELLDDQDGNESTLLPIQAKKGKARWLWSSRRLKGAVEIQQPDGEVFVRGNQEQQLYLIEFLRQFTEEWDGEIPKPPNSAKQKSENPASSQSHKEPMMLESYGGLQRGVFTKDEGKFGFIRPEGGGSDMFVLPDPVTHGLPAVTCLSYLILQHHSCQDHSPLHHACSTATCNTAPAAPQLHSSTTAASSVETHVNNGPHNMSGPVQRLALHGYWLSEYMAKLH